MPDLNAPIKLGANCWNQYTDWPSWLGAMQRAEFDRVFSGALSLRHGPAPNLARLPIQG